MELRQLRYFVAIAETRNFRAAAQKLNMTQPPLSVAIRKLETEIGAELFIRSTKQVELTSTGRAVLKDARELLFDADELKRKAAAVSSGMSGELRLGFVGSAKNCVLPRLLPEFRHRFPKVALRVFEMANGDLASAILDRRLDMALMRAQPGEYLELRTSVIEEDEFAIALPADHPHARTPGLTLSALSHEPFIGFTSTGSPGLAELSRLALDEAGVSPPVVQQAVQVVNVLFLVEIGMGFALVPSSFRHRLQPGVVLRPVSDQPRWPRLHLTVAHDPAFTSTIAETMIDLCVNIGADRALDSAG